MRYGPAPALPRRARAVALSTALLVGGCTGSAPDKAPEPFGTRAATEVLRDAVVLSAVKATLIGEDPDSTMTVRVSVTNGVVVLRGSVKDAATRERLAAAARRSAGVKQVANELRLDPRGARLGQQVGDAALAARIQAALVAQVGFQHVTVHVDHGVATLSGTVADAQTKATVLATARGTSGIRNVADRIRVAGP